MLTSLKLKSAFSKEKILFLVPFLVTVALALWISHSPSPENGGTSGESEVSVTIPRGFSIIPLELSNSAALGNMVTRFAVISVFEANRSTALIENLRILKLSAGEGPLFGALVPDQLVGQVQDYLTHRDVRGVLKPTNSGSTEIHLRARSSKIIQEVPIGGE